MRYFYLTQRFQTYKLFSVLVLLLVMFSILIYWNSKISKLELSPEFEIEENKLSNMFFALPTKAINISRSQYFSNIKLTDNSTKYSKDRYKFPVTKYTIWNARLYDSTTNKPIKYNSWNTTFNFVNIARASKYINKIATFNDSIVRTQLSSIFMRATCPPELEIDRRNEEWYVKRFRHVSPFTKGQYELQNQTVVILTPISNIADKIKRYFQMICALTYPKSLSSIVLGEDSSIDATYSQTRRYVNQLLDYYPRVSLIHLPGKVDFDNVGLERHSISIQMQRRQHMANARNQLLQVGLGSEDWVLWLDSDLMHIPENLIEHMLSARKDIVTVNTVCPLYNTSFQTYDKNNWRETNESLRHANSLNEGELMFEGYVETKRKYLNDLKGEGMVVRLDGVGGCALLVNASLHKRGLEFPNYVFHHHIETEGLAKMALIKFKVQSFGLPYVTMVHP